MSSSHLSYVVRCEIDDDLETVLTLRKNNRWYYFTVNPKDIQNGKLKNEYKRLAGDAQRHQQAYDRMVSGEDTEKDQQILTGSKDSGYGSDTSDHGEERDAKSKFETWLQEPMAEILKASESHESPRAKTKPQKSLSEWYNADIALFRLHASKDDTSLQAEERDDLDGEKFIRDTLTPNIAVPKYIQNLKNARWVSPDEVIVLEESDDIHLSIHPTCVQVSDDNGKAQPYFLKLASQGDDAAVKREIKFLHDMERLGVYDEGVCAPHLEGVVTVPWDPSSHERVLGFLLTQIPQPCTPLTDLMKNDVDEKKRHKWADETERMVKILHKHDLIWGDAKADNFIVDKNEKLWMIDFGGGFTVGWIEPRHAGTQKGDLMGTQKIADGMRNPEAEDPEESSTDNSTDEEPAEQEKSSEGQGTKRGHVALDDAQGGNDEGSNKRRK